MHAGSIATTHSLNYSGLKTIDLINSIIDLDEVLGELSINETGVSKHSLPDESRLSLTGIHGVWGRSILLRSADGRTACATVAVSLKISPVMPTLPQPSYLRCTLLNAS